MRRNITQRRYAMLQRRYAAEQKENQRLKKELAENEEFFGGLKLYVPVDAATNN